MNEHYEMVSSLQRLFSPNTIGDIRRLKLEFLIYRLKRLLLMKESCSEAEMAMVCPLEELEGMKTLFLQMKSHPDSLDELEDGFKRIIARIESMDTQTQYHSRLSC